MLMVTDPDLAQFFMNINPEVVRKAGLSFEMFGDDKNGFLGSILYEEGAQWHRSRKLLGQNFNLTQEIDVRPI